MQSLKSISEAQKILFLLAFTREMVKNSGGNMFLLKNIVEEEEKKNGNTGKNYAGILSAQKEKEKIFGEKLAEKLGGETAEKNLGKINKRKIERMFSAPQKRLITTMHPVLRIPVMRLPPRFQYLKPTPTNLEIDLGKLNPFILDPMVQIIECQGPNKNLIVSGGMGRKPTSVVFDRSDIDDVIERISKATRIPSHEGVYKVVAGRIIFTAIISDVIGSKFIIQKMAYNPNFRR